MVIAIYFFSNYNIDLKGIYPKGGISFDWSVNFEERQKISSDLYATQGKYFSSGYIFKISKYTFPNCNKSPEECSYFKVNYIYNRYGDNLPGNLKLEDGVYKFYPSM
ncbi:MAG: hypothetical protein ABIS11_00550 [Candidatus Dojkabacteria bacterium]